MRFRKQNRLVAKVVTTILKLVYILIENSDDSKPQRNGEVYFVNQLRNIYKEKDFVLFDVGANLGEYTDFFISQANKNSFSAYLFEPQKKCYELLQKKFGQSSSIRLNNIGLSDKNEERTLYTDRSQSPLGSLYQRDLSYFKLEMAEVEKVKLCTASEYVYQNKIEHINLLKIDVEGHEIAVLKGFGDFLSPENIDFIQFEYGGTNIDSHTTLKEMHDLLRSKGFVVCKMMRKCLEIREFQPYMENFVYQNWVAVSPKMVALK